MAIVGARDFNGEDTLESLIDEINLYLQDLGSKRLNRLFGRRSRVHYCQQSWARVNVALTYFVENPKRYYGWTMQTIEIELGKFPPNSGYSHQLRKLAQFLAQGPSFSENYTCKIRIPAVVRKNWERFNKLNENE